MSDTPEAPGTKATPPIETVLTPRSATTAAAEPEETEEFSVDWCGARD